MVAEGEPAALPRAPTCLPGKAAAAFERDGWRRSKRHGACHAALISGSGFSVEVRRHQCLKTQMKEAELEVAFP